MITKEQKLEIIKLHGGNEKNSGDVAAQIAILTAEIEDLKPHFEANKKDNHSKRGFLAKIEKRKKLQAYLRANDFEKYQETIKILGLRK